jgi:hypothetical protein
MDMSGPVHVPTALAVRKAPQYPLYQKLSESEDVMKRRMSAPARPQYNPTNLNRHKNRGKGKV